MEPNAIDWMRPRNDMGVGKAIVGELICLVLLALLVAGTVAIFVWSMGN